MKKEKKGKKCKCAGKIRGKVKRCRLTGGKKMQREGKQVMKGRCRLRLIMTPIFF